jgi:anti-sigma factor ChrR (cupin superfamily)
MPDTRDALDAVRDLLPLHALGLLEADEIALVERAVAADPALAVELASYRDTAAVVGSSLPPLEPSRAVWDRLLGSIGAGRFEAFTARVSKLFDVSVDRARELLGWIEDPARWEPFKPGSWLLHFEGGPSCATADCGFVRVAAGATFPWHAHDGEETTIVLAGGGRDNEGKSFQVGDEWIERGGSQHEFTAEPGDDYLFAVRVFGVRFDVTKPS